MVTINNIGFRPAIQQEFCNIEISPFTGNVQTGRPGVSLVRICAALQQRGNRHLVIPENGFSVARLLKGKLLGSDNQDLASIDNISFRNGRAALVIAAYNQVLNMGGEQVAIDFKPSSFVRQAYSCPRSRYSQQCHKSGWH